MTGTSSDRPVTPTRPNDKPEGPIVPISGMRHQSVSPTELMDAPVPAYNPKLRPVLEKPPRDQVVLSFDLGHRPDLTTDPWVRSILTTDTRDRFIPVVERRRQPVSTTDSRDDPTTTVLVSWSYH